MANFPSSLDDGTTLPNPAANNAPNNPSHAGLHDTENAAIIALETKLGISASTPANGFFLIGSGAGSSAWRAAVKADVGLSNVDNTADATKNAAAVTLTNKTLTTPVIGSFINAQHNHSTTGNGGLIGDSGISGVSAVKFSNPYKFSVYRAAAQNTNTSFVKVGFDTKEFDTSSNFDATTNSRFVAPETGFYFFQWMVGVPITGAGSDTVAALYKNGTVFKWSTENSVSGGVSGSTLVSAAASDYFEIFVVTTSVVALNVGVAKTYFSGFLVSKT